MTPIAAFVDEGLGHSSYLVDLGDGRALLIDPPRFPEEQQSRAAAAGLEIAFAADTHTHADYVSGSPQLAAAGVTFLAPAAARLESPHTPLRDGDTVAVGHYELQAIATPGHTPDHMAYLLLDHGTPIALFSGGSLMVGTAGRTDLAGSERTDELAHAQYRSIVDRELTLPDTLAVYPTHGRGSFCSAPGATQRATSIGRERDTNPLLQFDEDTFVERLVSGFGTLPHYFHRLPEINRRGPRLYDEVPRLERLLPVDLERHIASGGLVVDTRPFADFAAGHIPGSISNALRTGFATWLAVAVPADARLAFVLADTADEHDVVRGALGVGHEALVGVLESGIEAWRRAGNAVATIALVEPDALDGEVVDVRQREEFAAGHVPGARNVELEAVAHTPIAGDVTMMCGHGERAMTAASLLARAGLRVQVLDGGADDVARARGLVARQQP